MLNYLNNKFTNSSAKTKIELYLLPLLLLYLCYFLFEFSLTQSSNIEEIKPKVDVNSSNKEFKESFLDLFTNLEDYALKKQIVIFTLTNNKKIIVLKAKANLSNIQKFIKKIESINSVSKIKNLTVFKADLENYIFEMEVDLSTFYIKKIEKEIENQSSKLTSEIKNNEKSKEYKISGIISEYAFINDIWLKKDENIDDLKVTQVEKDFVVLENENKKIILELNNEEYFKKPN